uniref:DUF4283 domain-containing protein n=1 Tax=Tanacetum cinerariifolium TaxID=118510 RepID=A0A6L2NJE5_TANCI|nr:hypothetical protein [Tanacetum cinerariifolium]
MSVKYPNYVNLTSSSEEQPNERIPSSPPIKKSLSPPQAPSESISSKSTHYTSSSSPSESLTPTHIAPPPKLRFVIPIKLKPQELPPPQISPNDPYDQSIDNWPPGPSTPSPPPRVSRPPLGFPNPPPEFEPLPSTQPLFVSINKNTPLLHNIAPPLENIHHPPSNLGNQDFSNPPNILDFVHSNDMPHLHNMIFQWPEGGSKKHKASGSSSFNKESGDASINLNTNVVDEDDVQEIRLSGGRDKARADGKNKGSKTSGSSTMNGDALARLMVTEMTAQEKPERLAFMEIKRRDVEYRKREVAAQEYRAQQEDIRFYLQPYDHLTGDQRENVKEKSINDELMDTWNDPSISAMHSPKVTPTSPPKSFLDAVVVETHNTQPRVNFRSLIIDEHVENSDCVLPMEHVIVAQNKFANSLVGFFVGKKVAFQLVQNYVKNTWTKFGFQYVMHNDDDVYYFKFTSMTGLEQVTKVPVWVKIHKVPMVAYSEDGLSIIATQIGKPIMLDAFTSAMCAEPWGRLGFARALVEVTAEKELKSQVTMAVPMVNAEGHSMAKMDVIYEWKPSRCDECLVFGHTNEQCPKRVIDTPKKLLLSKMMDSPLLLIGRTKELEGNGKNNNGIKLRNLFDKLNDISYQVDPNSDMGDVGITSDTTKLDEDSDSEVEEVFRNWDWISNASLCDKGCRIILGWNKDLVDVLLLTQTSQAIHTKVLHKAENKVLYCSFIYAGNKTIERRTLWADLDLHKYHTPKICLCSGMVTMGCDFMVQQTRYRKRP